MKAINLKSVIVVLLSLAAIWGTGYCWIQYGM